MHVDSRHGTLVRCVQLSDWGNGHCTFTALLWLRFALEGGAERHAGGEDDDCDVGLCLLAATSNGYLHVYSSTVGSRG